MIKRILFLSLLFGFIGCFGSQDPVDAECLEISNQERHKTKGKINDQNILSALFALNSIYALSQRSEKDVKSEVEKHDDDELLDDELYSFTQNVMTHSDAQAKKKHEEYNGKMARKRELARRCIRNIVANYNNEPFNDFTADDAEFLVSWGLYEWVEGLNDFTIQPAIGTDAAIKRFMAEYKSTAKDDSKAAKK